MNTTTHPLASPERALPLAARTLLRLLQGLSVGALDVQLPDGQCLHFGTQPAPRAAIRIHDWPAFGAILARGDIGFGEGFVEGHWSTPDLPALLELLLANRSALERALYGRWWGSLLHRLRHAWRRNSRSGSRRNVHAHYDLGNAFYRLWLDASMNYSSAWFNGDSTADLTAAQNAKVERALDAVGLQPGQRVLEIGCGWGAVAEAAARRGAQVTGLTLSTEQLAWAQDRLARAGLAERADLRLQDYRDLDEGPYDAIVSIEMFEAVGRAYWEGFFSLLQRRLAPGARACIQTITIRDDLFDRYVRSTDFIQQYIFPGGLLPSAGAFRAEAQRAGLRIEREQSFGADYAETLRRWRLRFLEQERAVRDLGFDTRFVRIWDFYLAYCQAAFAAGNTDVVQFTLRRP